VWHLCVPTALRAALAGGGGMRPSPPQCSGFAGALNRQIYDVKDPASWRGVRASRERLRSEIALVFQVNWVPAVPECCTNFYVRFGSDRFGMVGDGEQGQRLQKAQRGRKGVIARVVRFF
jgi:hypothetical protein